MPAIPGQGLAAHRTESVQHGADAGPESGGVRRFGKMVKQALPDSRDLLPEGGREVQWLVWKEVQTARGWA